MVKSISSFYMYFLTNVMAKSLYTWPLTLQSKTLYYGELLCRIKSMAQLLPAHVLCIDVFSFQHEL